MNIGSPSFALLKSPWGKQLETLLSQVEQDLVLASPFVKASRTSLILAHLRRRDIQNQVRLQLLTDLRPESALSGSTDLEAFVQLSHHLPKFELTHLPSLHAKVYLADLKMAIITSGNLTDAGIEGNLEYGIVSADRSLVSEVRRDFESFALLGAKISSAELTALLEEIEELKELFKNAERTIRVRARRLFQEKLKQTKLEILRHRAKGKTTNAILSESILFLLRRGPLRTADLHPLIQRLHPDICDDSIDRVIDGVHFGKKWKHHVRNAQQHLKREGQIRYDNGYWYLVS